MLGSLYVSPYLDVDNPRLPKLRDRLPKMSDRLRVRAARFDLDTTVVFDALTNGFVTVARRDRALLERLAGRSFRLCDLTEDEIEAVDRLQSAGLIFPAKDVFRKQNIDRVPIEINTHCNFRCSFCPVAAAPKPKAFMAMDVFEIVLDRVVEAGVTAVSLNHYGEPSLDPALVERIRKADERGLQVDLYSNFSRFTNEAVKEIAEIGNTRVVVNLPSLDHADYQKITKWKLLDRVTDSLRYAVSVGLPLRVTLNAPAEMTDAEKSALQARIRDEIGCDAQLAYMETRAGSMTNDEYAEPVHSDGLLNGCYRMLTKIAVNVKGQAFLCCQDYDQDYVLGDLRTQSLHEIAESDAAEQIRRWVFGAEEPPADFICRHCEETRSKRDAKSPLSIGGGGAWLGETAPSVHYRSALPARRKTGDAAPDGLPAMR